LPLADCTSSHRMSQRIAYVAVLRQRAYASPVSCAVGYIDSHCHGSPPWQPLRFSLVPFAAIAMTVLLLTIARSSFFEKASALSGYGSLNQSEVDWCFEAFPSRLSLCVRAYVDHGRAAVHWSRHRFPDLMPRARDPSDVRRDALRHCVWSARLADAFGEDTARGFLERHESDEDPDSTDTAADRRNNDTGVKFGLSNGYSVAQERCTSVATSHAGPVATADQPTRRTPEFAMGSTRPIVRGSEIDEAALAATIAMNTRWRRARPPRRAMGTLGCTASATTVEAGLVVNRDCKSLPSCRGSSRRTNARRLRCPSSIPPSLTGTARAPPDKCQMSRRNTTHESQPPRPAPQ
jgi:hypothetical protein